jgi:hypothetical protein
MYSYTYKWQRHFSKYTIEIFVSNNGDRVKSDQVVILLLNSALISVFLYIMVSRWDFAILSTIIENESSYYKGQLK